MLQVVKKKQDYEGITFVYTVSSLQYIFHVLDSLPPSYLIESTSEVIPEKRLIEDNYKTQIVPSTVC